ncbi:E3 ubiquitin-protein ligase RBBP6 [Gossypium australe]|uniref:E3 ubiquitin-protein ligase RBBP6 n=1 Tax=Gossypium australe TaxID=47621 RepID=A0A5B6VP91_9ROSI|nr:E3 ubiquitin-protein ligase RBBP6 [Gossypium australe]
MIKYEQKFVNLSKYAQKQIASKAKMCSRFECELNENIRAMVRALDIKEFVVLSEHAQKMEAIWNEKKKLKAKNESSSKRSMSRNFSSPPLKRSKKFRNQSVPTATCRLKRGACFQCGSIEHSVKYCPNKAEVGSDQQGKSMTISQRGRKARSRSALGVIRSEARDSTVKTESRAQARAYAIRAREEATAPNVIAGSDGYEFPVDLMMLPFEEFDVILGMDWLIVYDAIVSCRKKRIMLKRSNGDSVIVETKRLNGASKLISTLSAQKMIWKCAEAFLAYIINTQTSK